MNKICFVCETPYQLFNIVRMVANIDDIKHTYKLLYISKKIRNSELIINNLYLLNIFNEIYIYDYNKNQDVLKSKIYELFFPRKYLAILLENTNGIIEDFSCIYLPVYVYLGLAILRINKNSKVIFYEDGLASYTPKRYNENFCLIRRIIFKFGGTNSKRLIPSEIYLNYPTLILDDKFYKKIHKIPSFDQSTIEIVTKLFSYNSDNLYYDKDVIYISQPVSDNIGKNDVYIRNEVINCLSNNFKNRTIVRLHPRDNDYCNDELLSESKCNWELLSYYSFNEKTILITSYSTAAFIPKLLFNKEPFVIFLFPMYSYPQNLVHNINELIERFRKIYINQDRIILIKDSLELINVLKNISSYN